MSDALFTTVGRIVKTHGLKGEVSVVPATDLPFMLHEGLHVWMIPPPAGVRDGIIEGVRSGPKGPLVKISGIDDIDAASRLRGSLLSVRSDEFPDIFEAKAFDPVGLIIEEESGSQLGTVIDVIITGANDVWVINSPAHGEVLIPVIDDVVLDIDEDARSATVRLLPGLLDEEGT